MHEHLGLIAGAVVLTVIALRILAISGWDPTTALGVVQAQGGVDITLSIAIASLPIGFTIVFGGLAGRVARELRDKGRIPGDWWMYGLAGVAVFSVMVPWVLGPVVVVLWILCLWTFRRKGARAARAVPQSEAQSTRAGNIAVGISAVFTWSAISYLPAEVIQPSDGKPMTGYVLSQDDSTIVTLVLGDDREIERIPAEGTERKICDTESGWLLSTAAGLVRGSPYSECPND